ncbi:MAG: class II aldolase/adducin family protein [Desulfovibrio sp.]|jgi:rhamnose utilization protein RhaD (predicted bifunctional aldolase and dehydrogenase)|nr:class II aldolase/adducin family protein [Desulfovibrio sp.]
MSAFWEDFVWLAAAVGSNPLLIQGPGGNVSLKDGDDMWVKASGRRLCEALDRNIFARLSRRAVLEALDRGEEVFCVDGGGARPSVETPLHALIPQRIVLHLHMLDAVIRSGLPEGGLAALLDGLSWRLLPYARPGLPLSSLVRKSLEEGGQADVHILENHGVVVAAEDGERAIFLVNELIRRLWLAQRPFALPDATSLRARNDAGWGIPVQAYPHALAFGEGAAALLAGGPLWPDQNVFLGRKICVLGPKERLRAALEAFEQDCGFMPVFAVVPEGGVLFSPKIGASAAATVSALGQAALRLPGGCAPRPLSEAALDELDNWDGEKSRKTLDGA